MCMIRGLGVSVAALFDVLYNEAMEKQVIRTCAINDEGCACSVGLQLPFYFYSPWLERVLTTCIRYPRGSTSTPTAGSAESLELR